MGLRRAHTVHGPPAGVPGGMVDDRAMARADGAQLRRDEYPSRAGVAAPRRYRDRRSRYQLLPRRAVLAERAAHSRLLRRDDDRLARSGHEDTRADTGQEVVARLP